MSEVMRAGMRAAIEETSSCIHNSQEWSDPYYADDRGRTLMDQLLDRLVAMASHDATPATIEWWKSLGAHQLWADDDTLYVTKDAGYDCNEVGLGTSNCIGWEVADTFGGERSVAMIGSISGGQGPATRGEVRRLASALGIPLKESP